MKVIRQQLKIKMLASVREDYLVTVIDEPFVPEIKSSPSRFLITIIGAFLGFFISKRLGLSKEKINSL